MRNREAARYARWAAITAGLIALAVAGDYAARAFRRSHAGRSARVAVPVTVQQQSAQFSFSKVEQDRTIFTVRASHATQYKDQNRARARGRVDHPLRPRRKPQRQHPHARMQLRGNRRRPLRRRCRDWTWRVRTRRSEGRQTGGEPGGLDGHAPGENQQPLVQSQYRRGLDSRARGIPFPVGTRTRRGSVVQHERFNRARRARR